MNNKLNKNHYLIIILVFSLAGIASFAMSSVFTRLFKDDFCVAAQVQDRTFTDYFIYWYTGWTGRFSYIIFTGLSGLLGVKFFAIFPTLIILSLFFSLIWAVLPLFQQKNAKLALLSTSAYVSLFLLFLLVSLPNIFESVFWNVGAVNYSMPLIGFTLTVGILARIWTKRFNHWTWLIPIILLTFIGGGYTEIFSILQLAIFALALLTIFITDFRRKNRLFTKIILAGLFASLIALIVVYLAPGNDIRQAATSQGAPTALFDLPFKVLESTWNIFYRFVRFTRLELLPMLLIPFSLGLFTFKKKNEKDKSEFSIRTLGKNKQIRSIFLIAFGVLIVSLISAIPTSYALGDYLPSRAAIIPFYFIIHGILFIFFIFSSNALRTPKIRKLNIKTPWVITSIQIISLIVFILFVGMTVVANLSTFKENQQSAQYWDQRHAALIALADEGILDAKYPGLENDPKYWVNKCIANYYDFSTIQGK